MSAFICSHAFVSMFGMLAAGWLTGLIGAAILSAGARSDEEAEIH